MNFVGGDPGKQGGLAWVYSNGVYRKAWALPLTFSEVNDHLVMDTSNLEYMLSVLTDELGIPDQVLVENVHSMSTDAKGAAFTFGWTSSALTQYLSGKWAKLWSRNVEYVNPAAWQKVVLPGYYALSRDLKSKQAMKAAAVELLSKVYPTTDLLATDRSKVPHGGMVDALCIAHYGSLVSEA